MKDTKGITLIALIITIIVMLILVGVTVNIAIGENGLISTTKDAKKQMEKETFKEVVAMIATGEYDVKASEFNLIPIQDKILENYPNAKFEYINKQTGATYCDGVAFKYLYDIAPNKDFFSTKSFVCKIINEDITVYLDSNGLVDNYTTNNIVIGADQASQFEFSNHTITKYKGTTLTNIEIPAGMLVSDATNPDPGEETGMAGQYTYIIETIGEASFECLYPKIRAIDMVGLDEVTFNGMTTEEFSNINKDLTNAYNQLKSEHEDTTQITKNDVMLKFIEIENDRIANTETSEKPIYPEVGTDGYVYVYLNGITNNAQIEAIKISNGISYIKSRAFANNYMLRTVEIPKTVKTIASDAFENCYGLKTIKIDKTSEEVKKMSNYTSKWNAPNAKIICSDGTEL